MQSTKTNWSADKIFVSFQSNTNTNHSLWKASQWEIDIKAVCISQQTQVKCIFDVLLANQSSLQWTL